MFKSSSDGHKRHNRATSHHSSPTYQNPSHNVQELGRWKTRSLAFLRSATRHDWDKDALQHFSKRLAIAQWHASSTDGVHILEYVPSSELDNLFEENPSEALRFVRMTSPIARKQKLELKRLWFCDVVKLCVIFMYVGTSTQAQRAATIWSCTTVRVEPSLPPTWEHDFTRQLP